MFEIGSTLREARERRRVGLDQAEAETKIRARYLRALEEEDFVSLPGPTYVKGFLRTYADYLGLDGGLFVDEYNSRYGEPWRDYEPTYMRRRTSPGRSRRRQRESNLILVALAGIVALALLVFVASTYPRRGGDAPPPAVPRTQATAVSPPINPALAQTTGTDASAPRPVIELIVRANAPAAVKIWRGAATTGKPVIDTVLDPAAADGGRTKRLRSRTGYTVVAAEPRKLLVFVDGVPQPLPDGARFRIGRDGSIDAVP